VSSETATPPRSGKASPAAATSGGEPFWADRVFQAILTPPLAVLAEIGTLAKLLGLAAFWAVRPPFRPRLFIEAMDFIGVGSIFIVGLTGTFVGMVFGLQLVEGFRQFGAESQTGSVVGLALTRELSPVFAALMVSARGGSAMTTELGSMRVTDQIDALTTMAVNPVQYLVVPRLVAGLIMVPMLAMLSNTVGLMGAFAVSVYLQGLDPGIFMDRVTWYVDGWDLSQGLIKAGAFGFAISLIACRQGFFASGGAAGVGRATNRSVVHSAIMILVLDYLLTSLFIG